MASCSTSPWEAGEVRLCQAAGQGEQHQCSTENSGPSCQGHQPKQDTLSAGRSTYGTPCMGTSRQRLKGQGSQLLERCLEELGGATLPFNLRRLPHREAACRGGRLVNGCPGNEILVLNTRKNFLLARTGHRQNKFLLRSKPTSTRCVRAGTMTFQPPTWRCWTQEVIKEKHTGGLCG